MLIRYETNQNCLRAGRIGNFQEFVVFVIVSDQFVSAESYFFEFSGGLSLRPKNSTASVLLVPAIGGLRSILDLERRED
jgi:hypothetical protein